MNNVGILGPGILHFVFNKFLIQTMNDILELDLDIVKINDRTT